MRYTRYLRLEKNIAASDTGGITERWRFGRGLLADDKYTTPNGNLRNGARERLIAEAAIGGYKVSKSEIAYRLQCARAYETEAQLSTAREQFADWTSLREAGFPSVQIPLDADTGPFDPRDEDERRRDAAATLDRAAGEAAGQLSLFEYFPDDQFDSLATLAELLKYAEDSDARTKRHARKDQERFAYLKQRIDAVNGDLGKTWEEAQAALEAANESP